MSNNELKELLKNSHKDLSVEDFEGKQVPCIGFEGQKFDDMLNKVAGKPLSVDTNLNILPVCYTHLTLPTKRIV